MMKLADRSIKITIINKFYIFMRKMSIMSE